MPKSECRKNGEAQMTKGSKAVIDVLDFDIWISFVIRISTFVIPHYIAAARLGFPAGLPDSIPLLHRHAAAGTLEVLRDFIDDVVRYRLGERDLGLETVL